MEQGNDSKRRRQLPNPKGRIPVDGEGTVGLNMEWPQGFACRMIFLVDIRVEH
jgi:hypothetical protein